MAVRQIQFSLFLLGAWVFAAPAWAQKAMYVKAPSAELKSSTAASAQVLATLSRGAKVDVQSTQGSWVKASAAGKQGWIYKFKLSTTKPSGENALAGLGGGGASAREGSTAASIRGLSPTSEKYAGRANIGPAQVQMVKRMESIHVGPQEVEAFLRAGKLGEFSGSP
ncbi:MAG TPA: SH3 domain-containing protein [Bdellovibrionota bacterium]|nr:SH3 domain-containing protein [Bdellovibrionota bacterium]